MATKIYTEIEINANAEKVWNVLTDISKHEEWNSLFKVKKGRFVKGTKLDITINDMGFKPKVLTVDVNKKLVWLGRFLFPGLFDGKHQFEIVKLDDNRVLFKHYEDFKGILVPFMRKSLNRDIVPKFEEMNLALKRYIEAN